MGKERDIQVKIDDVILNCRAVGIIEKDNKVLFQKRNSDKYWALPGGKIRVREQSSECLKRELEEEIGIKVEIKDIFSVSEYFFDFENLKVHQYIFAYKVKVLEGSNILDIDEFEGIEVNEDLVYKWIDINDIDFSLIKPDFLKIQLKNIDKKLQFNFYQER